MKRKLLFSTFLLIFVVVISPMLVMAQDEDLEMEEYEDEDGAFSLSHPVGWAVLLDEEEGALMIANSEETLEAMSSEEDLEIAEGQFGVVIFFFPADLLAMMGVDQELLASEETTPEEIAEAVITLFMEMEGEEEDEDSPVFGEPELLELDEETSIAAVPYAVESQNLEGAYFFYEVGDGVYALGIAAAPTGEFADNEEALGAILASLELNLSAEDLMEMYMGEEGEVEATEEP
jgi:hypothetical protein